MRFVLLFQDVVKRNAHFLLQYLLPTSQNLYRTAAGLNASEFTHLQSLVQKYPNLRSFKFKEETLKEFDIVGDV